MPSTTPHQDRKRRTGTRSRGIRIATWNCARGPFINKHAALDALAPDIVVLTESAPPPPDMANVLWFGKGRFGVAMYVRKPFRVQRSPHLCDVPCVYPVLVDGPVSFTLFGVWTWPAPTYKAALRNGLDAYAGVPGLKVFAGDFNGNVDFDRPRSRATWAQNFERLHAHGLVSAYHGKKAFGREAHPTHYFQWREHRPFHLDYCFVPATWRIRRVSVGNYADWARLSDHRPVVVDVTVRLDSAPPASAYMMSNETPEVL